MKNEVDLNDLSIIWEIDLAQSNVLSQRDKILIEDFEKKYQYKS